MNKETAHHFPNYKSSDEICQYIKSRSDGTCLLSFSGGKDAVASWLKLREHGFKVCPVYYYVLPGLEFVEQGLKYYEDYFKTKITRVPNPNLYRMLRNGVYQTPETNRIISSFNFPEVTFDDIFNYVKEDLGLPKKTWTAIGNRMFDNLNRYGSIKRYGAHNETRLTFYPVYDMKIKELADFIESHKVKLTADYNIWGKSFDGLDYRFMGPLKEYYPKDFEKIKSFFPLIETNFYRYG